MEDDLFKPCFDVPELNRSNADLDLEMSELDSRDLPSVDLGGLISYCCSCSCCC